MGKYFGTDGIRGIVDKDLDSELASKVGRALAIYLNANYKRVNYICIGKDTRLSGDMLENSIISGLLSSGISPISLGIIPTPAVSMLTEKANCSAGVVISASHNPVEYNGIKLFSKNGFKFDDKEEEALEKLIDSLEPITTTKSKQKGKLITDTNASQAYIDSVLKKFGTINLKGIKILVDCAFGSTYYTTPTALRELGARVIDINSKPDGAKINVNCGSTHPEFIKNYIKESKVDFDIAFAHDGDGDRVIGFLPNGSVIDGDIIMSLWAVYRKRNFGLRNKIIVGTIMTNMGIEEYLKRDGIKFIRSNVGDKYVLRDMLRLNAEVGGEQSGHIIFLEKTKTGDGLVTILEFLKVLTNTEFKILDEIKNIEFYSQKLTNIKVIDKDKVMSSPLIKHKIDELTKKNKEIRIDVRPSGTEPLIRILVETKDDKSTLAITEEIKNLIDSVA